MPRHTRNPALWFAALLVWFGILCVLSSFQSVGPAIALEHADKLLHFGYFLVGGVLMAGWRFRLQPAEPDWPRIIIGTTAAMALAGWIDEWHQTFTPGRSGGDVWDLLADTLGGSAGALVLRAAHPWLK